jgi:lantibiotic modifying enzyme
MGFLTGVTGMGYEVLAADSVGETGAVAYVA